eukprot:jgi/Botrbrau1/2078/Bobra.0047s0040.1
MFTHCTHIQAARVLPGERWRLPICRSWSLRGVRSTWNYQVTRSAPSIFDDLDIPDIEGDITTYQREAGATFSDAGVALTFQNESEVDGALRLGVAVADRSHCGRLRIAGEGRLSFLEDVSTNSFMERQPGEGCQTVFTTDQSGCLDLATCLIQETGVLLCVSSGMREALLVHLRDRLRDRGPPGGAEILDITPMCGQLVLVGPRAGPLLEGLGVKVQGYPVPGNHFLLAVKGKPVIVAAGSGLEPGLFSEPPAWTLIADVDVLSDLWQTFLRKGAVPMGEEAWERARIVAGCPRAPSELNPSVSPFQAGLYRIDRSLTGASAANAQLLAELKKKVEEGAVPGLWGISTSAPCAPGDPVLLDGVEVGRVTSACQVAAGESEGVALAYLEFASAVGRASTPELRVGGAPALLKLL